MDLDGFALKFRFSSARVFAPETQDVYSSPVINPNTPTHIALRWSADLFETRGYKHRAPPEQRATQTNLNRLLVQSSMGGFALKSRGHSSLCNLYVLCVSVVDEFRAKTHHRDTENIEVAQRNPEYGLFGTKQTWTENTTPYAAWAIAPEYASNLSSALR